MPDPIVVHCIQHSERVRPLTVAEWAKERGADLRVVRVDMLGALPPVPLVERVVVLGGAMNTDQTDEHPWINLEREWLREIVQQGRAKVLGICLGSQLLAEALGGSVERAAVPEIGWQRIERTADGATDRIFSALPAEFDAMQWHGDAWTLPPGAKLVATSRGCATQAFAWGDNVHGLQFHPEFTYERTRQLVETTTDDITPGGFVQSPDEFLADPARFERMRELCFTLLDRALL
jgi:GMP synthase (glutamine-hydrolysing)